MDTAGPTIALLFDRMGDAFLTVCQAKVGQKPGRLAKFSDSDLSRAIEAVSLRFHPSDSCPAFFDSLTLAERAAACDPPFAFSTV